MSGGSFLIEERTPDEVFTPEDFTKQHLLIAQAPKNSPKRKLPPTLTSSNARTSPSLANW
jgi:hypothetical protein